MSTDPTAEQPRSATPGTDVSTAGARDTADVSGEAAGTSASPPAVAHCASCGGPLASDQRYCLECGERRMPMSSFLLSSSTPASPGVSPAGPPAPPLPPAASGAGADRRSSALSVIAFVGVLLLAMGVGVLIGRAGNSKSSNPAPQVITVDAGSGGSTGGTAEAAFAGNWPAGKSGYSVQLQTLPVSGTAVSAVESAKSSATAKGAKNVGALKSEEFSSLASGNYVIYSGDYSKRSEAQKALSSLKKSFPAASVIHIAEGSGSGSGHESEPSETSQTSGAKGSSPTNPAPASVLKNLNKSRGKKYEEESNSLPDVVETGK